MSHSSESIDKKDVTSTTSPAPEDASIAKVEEAYNPELVKALENTRLDPLSRRAFSVSALDLHSAKREAH